MLAWLFRRQKVRETTSADVVEALTALQTRTERRFEELEDRVEMLVGQHRRMRGYVYAKKGNVLDTALDGAPASRKQWLESESRKRRLTRPELRELAGLAPPGSGSAPAEVPQSE